MVDRDTPRSEMDHARIDEDQLADRYLMRQLDETERRSFEEHFVDCPICLERLEAIEGLRGALKDLPAGFSSPTARAARVPPVDSRDRFAPRRGRVFVALLAAAACLVLATVASIVFQGEARRARRELEAVRQTSEKARQREARLESTLRTEQAGRPRPADEPARTMSPEPLAAASVFTLTLTRSGSADSADRVPLPDAAGWIVLLFDRPDTPGSGVRGYRVRLSTTGGRAVSEPVAASEASSGMLAVSVPSSHLPPDGYRLAVEDSASGNVLVTYRFRTVGRR